MSGESNHSLTPADVRKWLMILSHWHYKRNEEDIEITKWRWWSMCFISVPYIKQMLWDALHALKELAGRCCRHTDKCVWAVNVTIKPSCRSVHGWLFHVWRVQNENPEISHQLCPGHCPRHRSTLGTLTWKNCSQLLLSKRNQVFWQVHISQR